MGQKEEEVPPPEPKSGQARVWVETEPEEEEGG